MNPGDLSFLPVYDMNIYIYIQRVRFQTFHERDATVDRPSAQVPWSLIKNCGIMFLHQLVYSGINGISLVTSVSIPNIQ